MCIRDRAYSYLNETLGLDDFEAFLHEPATAKRFDNLVGYTGTEKLGMARSLAIFSAFAEGVSLYSAFAVLYSFQMRNLLKGIGQQMKWSVRDESLHSKMGCRLFNHMCEEDTELRGKTEGTIKIAAQAMVELEENYIENKNLLPVITSENDVYPYLKKINQFPILTDEEEKRLAIDWLKNGDTKAAQKLVTSHLRLVAKIAMGYKGYGLPLFDLISEGNLGLIQAIRKFDPEKGFRLATYAIWWIRASIQEYVLHSWSLVKIGTTAAQKKLFFNLRRLRNQLKKYEEGYLTNDQIKSISDDLGVTQEEVKQMEGRVFNQDFSLNTPLNDENDSEWIDQVEDQTIDTVSKVEQGDELKKRKALYKQAVTKLEPREIEILTARRLDEEPKTLEDLSQKYSISRERVRQIENKAIKKLQDEIKIISDQKLLPET